MYNITKTTLDKRPITLDSDYMFEFLDKIQNTANNNNNNNIINNSNLPLQSMNPSLNFFYPNNFKDDNLSRLPQINTLNIPTSMNNSGNFLNIKKIPIIF
jgi:hypothetical protein